MNWKNWYAFFFSCGKEMEFSWKPGMYKNEQVLRVLGKGDVLAQSKNSVLSSIYIFFKKDHTLYVGQNGNIPGPNLEDTIDFIGRWKLVQGQLEIDIESVEKYRSRDAIFDFIKAEPHQLENGPYSAKLTSKGFELNNWKFSRIELLQIIVRTNHAGQEALLNEFSQSTIFQSIQLDSSLNISNFWCIPGLKKLAISSIQNLLSMKNIPYEVEVRMAE